MQKTKSFLITDHHNTNYTPRISPHSYIKWISQQSLIGDFPYTIISIINLAENKKLIALKRHSSLLLSPKSKLKLHRVIFSSEKTKKKIHKNQLKANFFYYLAKEKNNIKIKDLMTEILNNITTIFCCFLRFFFGFFFNVWYEDGDSFLYVSSFFYLQLWVLIQI